MKKLEMRTNPTGRQLGKISVSLLLIVSCFCVASIVSARPTSGIGGKRDLDVMQANLYIGGNPEEILAVNPTNTEAFLLAVTGVYQEIVASQPEVRMAGVADAIAARMPDVVSVEEATLLRNGGNLYLHGTSPSTNVVYDYVQILLTALNARGVHYVVASTSDEWDAELPMLNLDVYPPVVEDIRQTDREAILVRADLPPGQLRFSNPQSGHFQNVIEFPTLGLSFTRGWCSVDLFSRGRTIRYICTHLEQEFAPPIQVAQVQELLNGPANIKLPVMIVGDFNSDPFNRDGSGGPNGQVGLAYQTLIGAGFKDTWAILNPNTPYAGLTWGHDQDLENPDVVFDRRIDEVFYKGGTFQPVQVAVLDLWLGRALDNPPLWASDHASLSAGFMLK